MDLFQFLNINQIFYTIGIYDRKLQRSRSFAALIILFGIWRTLMWVKKAEPGVLMSVCVLNCLDTRLLPQDNGKKNNKKKC